ncbi:extracellular solute-binding protein [Microbispora siamensis]|uniref:ABC transporter substrate-binding protein n=1 Tax=Microbispora siamensis TaxID=564413 RepID=A0ABQ4GZI7_9ACTN|nr:extracellular solute-binding protein [Microbispora siamensis]GIH66861.1 ABC transporter substrate-binding protein [Microbispora siamensis]
MSSDTIVIDAWFSHYPFPAFLETVRKRAEEFERAHPEYRIDITTCWWQKLPEEVAEAAAQGRPPTIASYYTGATQHARDTRARDGRPLYTSVEKAIGGRTEILGEPVVLDDLVDAVRGYYTLEGDLSSMPLTLSTMLLYTNMTVLRAAGIAEPPRTWDEVDAACQAIAKLDGGPSHGMAWVIDGKFVQHALAQQGAIFAGHRNGRSGRATTVDLATPEMLAYVDWWNRLYQRGHFLYTGAMQDWEGTFKAFTDQRIAFRLSSSFDAKYMVEGARREGFDIAVSPVPHNGRVPYAGNWIGGDSLWLADGLDEAVRDGALAFMLYLNNPRNAAEWHKVYGSAPVTKPALALLDEEGWFADQPYFRVASEQLEMMDGEPTQAVIGGYAHIQRLVMRAVEDVLVRGADPEARLKEATADAQALLDGYHAHCREGGPRGAYWLHVDS